MSRKRFPPRFPRFAAGIRAQEPRTGSGRSWWAMRWRTALEAIGAGPRLGRGRNYAASGQVVSLQIAGPVVTAKIVGARSEPYDLTMRFRAPEGAARKRIVDAIRSEPMTVARILADELPTSVEAAFAREGFDLFPGRKIGPGEYDTTTSCSCPDYANPCKHAFAVLLLLGEEADRRPATLLELRGLDMRELYED